MKDQNRIPLRFYWFLDFPRHRTGPEPAVRTNRSNLTCRTSHWVRLLGFTGCSQKRAASGGNSELQNQKLGSGPEPQTWSRGLTCQRHRALTQVLYLSAVESAWVSGLEPHFQPETHTGLHNKTVQFWVIDRALLNVYMWLYMNQKHKRAILREILRNRNGSPVLRFNSGTHQYQKTNNQYLLILETFTPLEKITTPYIFSALVKHLIIQFQPIDFLNPLAETTDWICNGLLWLFK